MSKRNRKVIKMENQNVIDTKVVDKNEETAAEEKEWKHIPDSAKAKEFGKKIATGLKKHGKKILAGAALVGGVLVAVGYELGRKKSDCESDPCDYTGASDAAPDWHDKELYYKELEESPDTTEVTETEETET